MYRVEYLLDGIVEDVSTMPKLSDALNLAADWQAESIDDNFPPQSEVTVTEIRLVATFPLGNPRK